MGCGRKSAVSDEALLRLGARVAEVEALYACLLDAPGPAAERRALLELAGAGARLAELACVSVGHDATVRRPTDRKRTAARPRTHRRIAWVQRGADWIIARAGGRAA
jgi:hypothetical protein